MFYWTGWEAETDLGNDDDREGVYFLTIYDPNDNEWAVIIHRTHGDDFPLDGALASEKIERANFIVDSLNESFNRLGG